MKLTSYIVPAIAALGFAVVSHAAVAETVSSGNGGADGIQKAPSTFTLIANRGGGRGGGMTGGHAIGGMGRGGGATMGARGGSFGGNRTAFATRGNRTASVRGGNRSAIVDRGGRRGYWRGGRWFPVGVGFGVGVGGSCYWNCRNSGRGPGFCRAYAFNYCY